MQVGAGEGFDSESDLVVCRSWADMVTLVSTTWSGFGHVLSLTGMDHGFLAEGIRERRETVGLTARRDAKLLEIGGGTNEVRKSSTRAVLPPV